jgi:hypothetical protein
VTSAFPDLPALSQLGDSLSAAFARAEQQERERPRPRRALVRLRPVLIAALVFALLAASAAAATLLVLRGSVIPAPKTRDLQPPMIVEAGSVHMSGVTARDPADGTTWSLRLARSRTGLVCVTAGELHGDRFGITGLDGRFRELAPGFTDGCGAAGTQRAAFVGARVFDSGKRTAVRTVVDGYGGKQLRAASVETVHGTRSMRLSPDGAFLGVVAGYPEDAGLRVRLRFASGHVETHSFGRSGFVAPDPDGALRTESFQISGVDSIRCVRVGSARQVRPYSSAPLACGENGGAYFFRALRLREGTRGGAHFGTWSWKHASRTLVYGLVDKRKIERITVTGAGRARRLRPAPSGAILAIFPPSVNPHRVQLVVTLADGSAERHSFESGLRLLPRRLR